MRALPRANTEDTRLYVRAALAGGRSFDQEDRATIAFFDQWVVFVLGCGLEADVLLFAP